MNFLVTFRETLEHSLMQVVFQTELATKTLLEGNISS